MQNSANSWRAEIGRQRAATDGYVRRFIKASADPWALASPLLLLLVLGFMLPLGRVLAISLTDPSPGLGNYQALVGSAGIRRMLVDTFSLALATAVVSIVVGYSLAAGIAAMGRAGRRAAMMILVFSLWLSVLIRTFGWLVVLGDRGLLNGLLVGSGLLAQPLSIGDTFVGVLIGMVHYMAPIATLPILSAIDQVDPRLRQAARSLGAGPWLRFWRVEIPLIAPGLASAALLVFLFALGFYIIPAILGGGRQTMIAEFISLNVLDLPRWGVASSCAAVLLAATILVLASLSRFGRLDRILASR